MRVVVVLEWNDDMDDRMTMILQIDVVEREEGES
jgi:hypothetical protein